MIKVVTNISDNIPSKVNEKENWGNYVIIDHWNGEFGEISHLKRGSITLKEGEAIAKGQITGYCGNSGLSYEAHIHYQLQRGNYAGAGSIPAKFRNYVKQTRKGAVTVGTGIPKEGELVRNNV